MTGAPLAPRGALDRLDIFRGAVRSGETDRLRELLIEDVRLRSPVRFKPYVGRPRCRSWRRPRGCWSSPVASPP